MPRIITPLNDRQIKALIPKEKAYTKADGNGLQLLEQYKKLLQAI